jgi:ankyrin repeat protein
MHASEHANWSSVSWFQNHGSSVHRKDLYGLNALMLASWYNEDPKRHKMVWDYPHAQRDTVRILCAAGAEVDATDGQGQTALMYATFSENIEVAEVLIQAGASTNIRDSEDRTLLDVAKLINSEKMISFYKQINVVE